MARNRNLLRVDLLRELTDESVDILVEFGSSELDGWTVIEFERKMNHRR